MPRSWDELIVDFSVHYRILESRVADSHDIVKAYASQHYALHILKVLLHGCQEAAEPVG